MRLAENATFELDNNGVERLPSFFKIVKKPKAAGTALRVGLVEAQSKLNPFKCAYGKRRISCVLPGLIQVW